MKNKIFPDPERRQQQLGVKCGAYLAPELVARAQKRLSDPKSEYVTLDEFLEKCEGSDSD